MNAAYRLLIESGQTEEERAAYAWLVEKAEALTPSNVPQPLRRKTTADVARGIVSCQLLYDEYGTFDCPRPNRLLMYDGVTAQSVDISSAPFGWRDWQQATLNFGTRGKLLVYLNAAKLGFHCLLRHFGDKLLSDGWQIQPLSTDTEIRAIIMRKDKHRWTLADASIVTGLADVSDSTLSIGLNGVRSGASTPLAALQANVCGVQAFLIHRFGVKSGITLASSSVRAGSTFLPADGWLWPPSALLEVMCRAGGAYRGGFRWARPYVGELWQIDLNRAYTWALTQPIPIRWAIGPCKENGIERSGIYLCRLSDRVWPQCYSSLWRGKEIGFKTGYWRGGNQLALLASPEVAGIRAIGGAVTCLWGMVACAHTTLEPFANELWRLHSQFGRGSPYDTIGKKLANAFYGKLGENPQRQERIYSREELGAEFVPGLTPWGAEIPDLWEHTSEHRTAHQHVDVAAMITAAVRGRIYEGFAALEKAGIDVVSAYVDSLCCTSDPGSALDLDGDKLGGWRLVDHNTDCRICSDSAWRFGQKVKVAGSQVAEAGVIDELWNAGEVTIAQRRMVAPWAGDAMYVDSPRVLRIPTPSG